MKKLQRN